jgi:hypothetical protein
MQNIVDLTLIGLVVLVIGFMVYLVRVTLVSSNSSKIVTVDNQPETESYVDKHLRTVEENHKKRLSQNEHLNNIKKQNENTYKALGRAELYTIKDPEQRKAAEDYLNSLDN